MTATQHLTVLYDPTCGFCVRCRQWLDKQPKLITMRFLPQGSSKQKTLYPDLQYLTDAEGRPEELIVIDDQGKVYRDDKAWVMCFYALRAYRPLSMRLARPGMAGLARRAYAAISTNRRAISSLLGMKGDDLRKELKAEPEVPHCNNALCALREAKAKVAAEQGG
ncbi:MAG: thiol-disulfide oxidoreductase DCC family protein [Phycisphaeraceae bacterium]